jgi:hypothetical protein
MEEFASSLRPDYLGGIGAYYGDGQFTSFSYFTSEADARAGESQPMPEGLDETMQEWQTVMNVSGWFDLKDPWITVR